MSEANIFSYYPNVSVTNMIVKALEDFSSNPEQVAKGIENPSKLFDLVTSNLERLQSPSPQYFALVLIIIFTPTEISMKLLAEDDRAGQIAKKSFLIRGMIDVLSAGGNLNEHVVGIIPTLVSSDKPEEMTSQMEEMLSDYYYQGAEVKQIAAKYNISRTTFYRMLEEHKLPKRTKVPEDVIQNVLPKLNRERVA